MKRAPAMLELRIHGEAPPAPIWPATLGEWLLGLLGSLLLAASFWGLCILVEAIP